MAIKAVLEICQTYNKTKNFTAYGFGAIVPPYYNVTMDYFPLSLNMDNDVHGIDGVMQAYGASLHNTILCGPTNFAPTIKAAAFTARRYEPRGRKYQILLIITDGIISDMEETKSAIIRASDLPLSIIIVGVGSSDFTEMVELDSDEQLLFNYRITAKRNIVQFVPFRKFMTNAIAASPFEQERLQYLLAKEVLAEVPGQVVSYMKANNIIPQPPQQPDAISLTKSPSTLHTSGTKTTSINPSINTTKR